MSGKEKACAAPGNDAVPGVGYPGGKSGSGIYQRLINLIPPHRVFVTAFAGHCGVLRRIKPSDHTIVIDKDEAVCEWWNRWRRSKHGRELEIHCCDSIEWLRHRFRLTEYSAAESHVGAESQLTAASAGAAELRVDRETQLPAAEAFVFADPPYVISERSHGKIYRFELDNEGHKQLITTLQGVSLAAAVMVCGYQSPLYAALDRLWRSIDHRVMTRGGLKDERIWLSFDEPSRLHDYKFLGKCRRERERIQRRQASWHKQLNEMSTHERQAMLDFIFDRFDRIPSQ